jgi:hypothetical protein
MERRSPLDRTRLPRRDNGGRLQACLESVRSFVATRLAVGLGAAPHSPEQHDGDASLNLERMVRSVGTVRNPSNLSLHRGSSGFRLLRPPDLLSNQRSGAFVSIRLFVMPICTFLLRGRQDHVS